MSTCRPPLASYLTHSAQETLALGERLAAGWPIGTVVALTGELGSGKTVLTKGIARGLGVSEAITSPTFTLIGEHPARDGRKLYHVDLYRLDRPQEAVEIGIEEKLSPDGWTIIEWAERLGDVLPPEAVRINIEIIGENDRRITVRDMRNAECGMRSQEP
ncbi:MAG: tRNA (adenosine(37)-N6)-threonylcarbamoyltransferase complex ATPase subunit type 1 TsaE [Verrucomicrobiae bacterium]|nr:tRNA (adenosine(37)-N6)-threonylcarbamoyltransferase complex ATPase subunit type 1 TsaE [Verrucomicrobiae bacterium]